MRWRQRRACWSSVLTLVQPPLFAPPEPPGCCASRRRPVAIDQSLNLAGLDVPVDDQKGPLRVIIQAVELQQLLVTNPSHRIDAAGDVAHEGALRHKLG